MRFVLLVLLLAGSLHAQTLTPRQSFEDFIKRITDVALDAASRQACVDRYFDFEAWFATHMAAQGREFLPAEKAELKQNWNDVLLSPEFRDRFRDREVRVLSEPAPDLLNGTAELVIELKAPAGTLQYTVLMTLAAEGTWWRWHEFVAREKAVTIKTPAERIAELESLLQQIAEAREALDQRESEVRTELKRLRAALAEGGDSKGAFTSPARCAETFMKAVMAADTDALLLAHTAARREKADRVDVAKRLTALAGKLAEHKLLDSTIDEGNPARATVRISLKLLAGGERVLTARLAKEGGEWRVDEEP